MAGQGAVREGGTHQQEDFAVWLDLVFLHVLDEAAVGVPVRTQTRPRHCQPLNTIYICSWKALRLAF